MARRTCRHQSIGMIHGSGGQAMHDLIEDVFLGAFDNPMLAPLEDQAQIGLEDLSRLGNRLAFTTDSFVVSPLFFPGGDIGTLAVCGTVNDLAVGGAIPLYLSCAVIMEEGLPLATLRKVTESMQASARMAGVRIVTGDTKVVSHGAADKLFINTAGIGVIAADHRLASSRIRPGDAILVNGMIGDHGAAIMAARGELALETPLESDCAPLGDLVRAMLEACPQIHAMRDATRGGLATVLNEFASASGACMHLDEDSIPVRAEVRGFCEILGLDTMYLANEGKLVAVVPRESSAAVLDAMRAHPLGRDAAVIGEVRERPEGAVIMKTAFGGERVVDMLTGDPLPRIC